MRRVFASVFIGLVLLPSMALGMHKHSCGGEVKDLSVLALEASLTNCCPQKTAMPEGCCHNEDLTWDNMATQDLSFTTTPEHVVCLGLLYATAVSSYGDASSALSVDKPILPPPQQGRHVLLRKGVLLL